MKVIRNKAEEPLVKIDFNIHKFTTREKPSNTKEICIFSCFSEFGCEILAVLYCIPRIKKQYPHAYFVAVGWQGRSYLYQHLVDEYWETKEEVQFLRDQALAFHNDSRNLHKLEKNLQHYGQVVGADQFGRLAVGNICQQCKFFWGQAENVKNCSKCNSSNILRSLFADIPFWKKQRIPLPRPSTEKMLAARKLLGPNPVAIFARKRATYGRNLQLDFYEKLVKLLQEKAFTPIWLGEKQSSYPCPVSGILDRTQQFDDLELTLALVSQCLFTLQYFTGSTRLSSVMETPFILFESPDQIYGTGQEGYRLSLCTTGKKKIVLCHYLKVNEDQEGALKLTEHCIDQLQQNNMNVVLGLLDEPEVVHKMYIEKKHRLTTDN